MNPLVSVIVPFHNASRFLEETILSVVKQTWKNIELILVNDGSTDDSLQVAEKFSGGTTKIITLKNGGAAAARNAGLDLATGRYVQFLDADDLLSHDKIEKQVLALAEEPGYLAICNGIHFWNGTDPNGISPRDESGFLHNSDDPEEFLLRLYGKDSSGWMVSLHSWLCPAEVLQAAGPWNETLTMDDDGEYFCRVVLASKGTRFVPGVYSYYRKFRTGDSLSANRTIRSMKSALLSLDLKAEALSGAKDRDRVFDRQYRDFAVQAYPEFMEVYHSAWAKIKRPVAGEAPQIGGPFIQMMSKWLGWRVARRISVMKRNLTK